MLGSAEVATVVADFLEQQRLLPIVLDPVLRSSSGAELIDSQGIDVIRKRLLRLCDVVTPNLAEAGALAQTELGKAPSLADLRVAAAKIHELGCRTVVITGGHRSPPDDYLSHLGPDGIQEEVFPGERIDSKSTHGTGCAFAMALACGLAKGRSVPESVQLAKDFVRQAMRLAHPIGKGCGPLHHLFRLDG